MDRADQPRPSAPAHLAAAGRRTRSVIDWLFRDRTTGRIVVAQWPNVALIAFLVARAADRIVDPGGTAGTALVAAGTVALLWWAADEVVRGVNPFRRALGAAVGVATLTSLLW